MGCAVGTVKFAVFILNFVLVIWLTSGKEKERPECTYTASPVQTLQNYTQRNLSLNSTPTAQTSIGKSAAENHTTNGLPLAPRPTYSLFAKTSEKGTIPFIRSNLSILPNETLNQNSSFLSESKEPEMDSTKKYNRNGELFLLPPCPTYFLLMAAPVKFKRKKYRRRKKFVKISHTAANVSIFRVKNWNFTYQWGRKISNGTKTYGLFLLPRSSLYTSMFFARPTRTTKVKPRSLVTLSMIPANVSIFPGAETIPEYFNEIDFFNEGTNFPLLLTPELNISANFGISKILFSQELLNAENRHEYLIQCLKLTDEDVTSIEKLTIGQARNSRWLLERRHRITASNFGFVLKAIERNSFPPSLFTRIDGNASNLDSVKPIVWGRQHEGKALRCFAEATGLTIQECGLWLHKSGMLGASPDGIIDGEDAILEIKCPYSFRYMNMSELIENVRNYILMKHQDQICLNPNHNYYAQIQGQLHITGRSVCYLVIWTTVDWLYIKVAKNPVWSDNISKLREFYMRRYVPYLVNSTINSNNTIS